MSEKEVAGTVEVVIGADNSDLVRKLDQIKSKMDETSKSTLSNIDKMKAGFFALSGSMAAFGGYAVREAYKYGNAIMDVRDKTGMAADEVSKLFAIGRKAGVSNESVDGMFTKMSRSAFNAAKEAELAARNGEKAVNAYAQLGVQLTDTEGRMRSSLEIFKDLTDAFKKMPDGVHKTALEMEIFGRTGTEVHDMLHLTREEMEETIRTAENLGLILSNEQAEGWKAVQIAGNDAKMAVQGFTVQIGTALLPTINKLIGEIKSVTSWFSNLNDQEKKNIAVAVEYGSKLLALSAGFKTVAGAIRMIGPAAASALGPIRQLIAALAIATQAWGAMHAAANNQRDASRAAEGYNRIQGYNDDTVSYEKDGKYYKETLDKVWVDKSGTTGTGAKVTQGHWRTQRGVTEYSPEETAKQKETEKARSLKSQFDDIMNSGPTVADAVSGGGGGGNTETALQKYKTTMSEIIRESELLRESGVKTREEHAQTIKEQIEGLKAVGVGTDEVRDKNITLLETQRELNEIVRQGWDENVRVASEANTLAAQSVQLAGLDKEAKEEALRGQLEVLQKNFDLLKETEVLEEDRGRKQQELNAILIEQQNLYSQLNTDEVEGYAFYLQLSEKKIDNSKKYLEYLAQEQTGLQERIVLLKEELANTTDPARRAAIQEELNLLIAKNAELREIVEKTTKDMALNTAKDMTLIGDAWKSSMGDLVKGTKDAADVMGDLFDSLLDQILQLMLFGGGGGGGMFGSGGGGLLGGIFGGKRAGGGPVKAGMMYQVRELGDEMFIPNTDGYILNASQTKNAMNSESGSKVSVSLNVINQTSQEVDATQEVKFDTDGYIINVFLREFQTNPQFKGLLK